MVLVVMIMMMMMTIMMMISLVRIRIGVKWMVIMEMRALLCFLHTLPASLVEVFHFHFLHSSVPH